MLAAATVTASERITAKHAVAAHIASACIEEPVERRGVSNSGADTATPAGGNLRNLEQNETE
uniref:hypothetical protein n=1 Tax=Enterobacter cloacae TaxID=550 RepID=UPI0037040A22